MDKTSGKTLDAFKTLAKPAAVLAGIAGSGYGGYKIGQGSGARKASNVMANQFQQYNEQENSAIAQEFFNRGVRASKELPKEAMDIYFAAYNDELEKIGAPKWLAATGEALNYETPGQSNLDRLSSLVTRVFGALQNGGIFLFDAILRPPDTATQYKTWRTGADWAVLIEARQSDPDLIEKQIITFRRAGNNYRRNEETHFVRLFRREAVEQLLIDSGFSVEIRAGYGTDRLLPGRRLFEARRPR